MRFMTFGNNKNKVLMFFSGTLMPWQMWLPQIQRFRSEYFVIIPVLDGHDTESSGIFTSVQKSASDIEAYCKTNKITDINAVCGASMGGVIACVLIADKNVRIKNAVLESAPLVPLNKVILHFWERDQQRQVAAIKKRDATMIKRYKSMYPNNIFEYVLNTIDIVDEKTVSNYCNSTFTYRMPHNIDTSGMNIAYWHGTTTMEILSKKAAKFLKANYPQIKIKAFNGYNHCELSVNHPEQYIAELEQLLQVQ